MRPGDVVADRFEVERVAGRGGMAVVYRAIDRATGGPVALKLLVADAEEAAVRFEIEGRALAELRHPGIVRWIAHGRSGEGLAYLAMEWLDGVSLSDRLRDGPLSVKDTLVLSERVAEALGAAHARGMIHRDVKPANVLLLGGDPARPKVLDFGVARIGASLDLTRTGVNPGTPAYMAPEQARGERGIDARADIFSLGGLVFRCLTGRAPFVGDDVMAVLAKLVFEDAPRVSELRPGVPKAVDALVGRFLSKDPDGRPANGDAAAREIAAIGEVGEGTADPTPAPRASLGPLEQRLLCVIVAGREVTLEPSVSAPTIAEDRPGKLEEARRLALEVYGARAEVLAVGTLVATVTGHGAATDLASRAARCALAIRAVLPAEPMAIATGRGVLGDRLPVGEAIDRAASALRTVAPGDVAHRARGAAVRLDEATAGLLDARFDVGGDDRGLVLWSERPEAAGPRTVLGRVTPFVGRDREKHALVGLFEDVRRDGGAGAVLVTGPAGSGKSRLRDELLAIVAAGPEPTEIWMARADPIRAGAPFVLAGGAIRDAAAIREGEDAAVRWRKLRARVGRDVAPADRDRVAEFLGELAGARAPGEPSAALKAARGDAVLMGDQMQRAFVDFVAATTKARGLCLVLEDVHWGDGPSLRYVDAALRALRDRPLFVLGLARPEGQAPVAASLAQRLLAQIRLGELSRKACEGLVRSVVGQDARTETVERIVERAEGNPFALEELLRAEAMGRGADAPVALLATIQARLEALPADDRRALRAASVYGRVFSDGGVAALVGESETGIRARLDALVDGEVLSRVGNDLLAFRHGLVRDAAYAMLTEADRALGHRLAAERLASTGAEAAELAEHFERGGEEAKAAPHWLDAAQRALEGNDFAAAVAWAGRAIRCGATGTARGECRATMAEAHRWRGEFAEAKACAEEALEGLAAGSDEWYRTVEEFAQTSQARGDVEGIARVAGTIVARSEDPATGPRLLASARLAAQLLLAAQFEPASRLFEVLDAAADAPAAAEPAVAARVHVARATRAHFDGDPATFLEGLRAAAACYEAAGDLRGAALQRKNAGFGCLELGLFEEAETLLRSVLASAEAMALTSLAAFARQDLGLVLARLGRLAEGLEEERAAVAAAIAQKHVRLEGNSRTYLATILDLAGEAAEAETEALRAVDLLANAPPSRCFALATLARARLSRGNTAEALETAKEASALLASLGGLDEGESLVRLVHAEALAATGDRDGATKAFEHAKARLMERAKRIAEPEIRKSFLERVPENAKTLAG